MPSSNELLDLDGVANEVVFKMKYSMGYSDYDTIFCCWPVFAPGLTFHGNIITMDRYELIIQNKI